MAKKKSKKPILTAGMLYDKMRGTGYEARSKKCFVIKFSQPTHTRPIMAFNVKCKPLTGSMRTHTAYIKYSNENIPLARQHLEMFCTCESWRYQGTAYIATKKGFSLFAHTREKRFPKIRDPKLQHFLCKHLIHILAHIKNKRPVAFIQTPARTNVTPDIKPNKDKKRKRKEK